MNDYLLQLLKSSLQILTVDQNTETYLRFLINASQEALADKGILNDGGDNYNSAVVQYASWLYRKRKSADKEEMPASLLYAIRNAWVKSNLQKKEG